MVDYMVALEGGWQEMDDRKKTALVMDLACADSRISSAVDRIWRSQFGWNYTTMEAWDLRQAWSTVHIWNRF